MTPARHSTPRFVANKLTHLKDGIQQLLKLAPARGRRGRGEGGLILGAGINGGGCGGVGGEREGRGGDGLRRKSEFPMLELRFGGDGVGGGGREEDEEEEETEMNYLAPFRRHSVG